jgi:hypothetical protein
LGKPPCLFCPEKSGEFPWQKGKMVFTHFSIWYEGKRTNLKNSGGNIMYNNYTAAQPQQNAYQDYMVNRPIYQ